MFDVEDGGEPRDRLLRTLDARPGMSVGLLSSVQGGYIRKQAVLDISQGSRQPSGLYAGALRRAGAARGAHGRRGDDRRMGGGATSGARRVRHPPARTARKLGAGWRRLRRYAVGPTTTKSPWLPRMNGGSWRRSPPGRADTIGARGPTSCSTRARSSWSRCREATRAELRSAISWLRALTATCCSSCICRGHRPRASTAGRRRGSTGSPPLGYSRRASGRQPAVGLNPAAGPRVGDRRAADGARASRSSQFPMRSAASRYATTSGVSAPRGWRSYASRWSDVRGGRQSASLSAVVGISFLSCCCSARSGECAPRSVPACASARCRSCGGRRWCWSSPRSNRARKRTRDHGASRPRRLRSAR